MKVLIGITSKNRAEILPKAIESALNQSYIAKEVWVFDDASSDDTFLLEKQYPEVKWIWSKEEKGYLDARNWMMQQKDFDLFCSLDDDSWFLDPNLLSTSIAYLKQHPKTATIAFDILSPDRNEKKWDEIVPKQSNTFYGCGHIIRLNMAKEVGYYIPNPGFYGGEEKDLCIKLLDHQYITIKLQGAYIWHDKSQIARDPQAQHQSLVLNDFVFCWRRSPLVMLFPYIIYKIISHLHYTTIQKNKHLSSSARKGVCRFFEILFKEKLDRKAVKFKTMIEFIKLS